MKRIILDTDIGTDVDDVLALCLVAASDEFQVEGVTTVHADAPLRARIGRRVLQLAGRPEIPVIAGASLPLQMPLPENFHWKPKLRGHEGVGILDSKALEPTKDLQATADDGAKFIINRATAYPGELSLITIGPLTNIGRALQLQPKLANLICGVTLMGGVLDTERFPWPPMFEVNLNSDPLASQLLFQSGIPITIVPMEVTTQVFLTAQQREAMRAWQQPLSEVLVVAMEQMEQSFADFSREVGVSGDFFQGRTYMHDPLAVYTSMACELVTVRRIHVQLEILDRVVRTIAYPDRVPNVQVCVDVQAREFVDFWLHRIRNLVMRAVA